MVDNEAFITSTSKLHISRRKCITHRPTTSINYFSLIKNCVGKDLSKIAMPANFNEPLSALQRTTEELEYAHLLDRAASINNESLRRMSIVAAFVISAYSTSGQRTTKPFNPLLNETFECDRRTDLGWRSFAEQISHHPPTCALHAEGKRWTLSQCYTLTSKIKSSRICVIPIGSTYLRFLDTGDIFVYNKVCTSATISNIVSGKLQTENHGELTIRNIKNGDLCVLQFHENFSGIFFSRNNLKKVTGSVRDSNDIERFKIDAVWDSYVKIIPSTFSKHPPAALSGEIVWQINELPINASKMYNFTKFAIELNEPEARVAPTDSRHRPDQRLVEQGDWNAANLIKQKLEEAQRRRQKSTEKATGSLWFVEKPKGKMIDKNDIYAFTGDYWRRKDENKWCECPKIFHL